METLASICGVRESVRKARAAGFSVELIPTMGAFHEGHLELMRRAGGPERFVVVSLFLNPTQFNQSRDLETYPRDLASDLLRAESAGVDLVFTPAVEEMYPSGFQTWVDVERLSRPLCGAARPGHFRGVATVVAKLLQLVDPDRAYFGEKDFQQLRIVQQLVQDLNFRAEIVPVPTVREPDGLAMSSRNALLSPAERESARALPGARQAVLGAFAAGERHSAALLRGAKECLQRAPGCRIDYVEIVDRVSLEPLEVCTRPALFAAAAFFGSTRLVDNAQLG
jgi:pantoate--beta-alanine ligase